MPATPAVNGSSRERPTKVPPSGAADHPTKLVGILALQGDFEAHAKLVRSLGAHVREVRTPADLEGLDALIIPGGSRR